MTTTEIHLSTYDIDLSILSLVYNCAFELTQLISTKSTESFTHKNENGGNSQPPKRALRQEGIRLNMPSVCTLASQLWAQAPACVRSRYEELFHEAEALHQLQFP
ncbi:30052_t:CDS:2, partial [Racocetra persica]